MVYIPQGTFMMGSDGAGFNQDEAPQHKVTISKGFRMSATEITNLQYEQFRPSHKELRGKGGFSSGDDEAVVFVSWYDACSYCKWLSEKTGKRYRLPTEAEWEYACRAGTVTEYNTGDSLPPSALKHQKTERNLVPVSLEVAQGEPNAFGLYDMHGNVEEWCHIPAKPPRTLPVRKTDYTGSPGAEATTLLWNTCAAPTAQQPSAGICTARSDSGSWNHITLQGLTG